MTAPAQTAAVALDRRLQFGDYTYPYYVRSGPGAWDELTGRLEALAADRFALVVSEGVPGEYVQRMTGCLRAAALAGGNNSVIVLQVPDGEDTKTLTAVRDMAVAMFKNGFTLRSVVVGFGGGKASNLAGLLAGLALRGLRLVQVPTTWLNLWDAAGASLKAAVNLFDEAPAARPRRIPTWPRRLTARLLPGRRGLEAGRAVGKNLVGLFWAPEFVFGTTDIMTGLPADQIQSAVGEVIKSVIAISGEQMPALEQVQMLSGLLRADARYTVAELVQIAGICVDLKQAVMRHDPKERQDALACEVGHTGGHVIELIWGLPHGIAVLIGCLIAVRVAIKLDILDPSVEPLVEDLVRRNGGPLTLPPGPSDREILDALYHDNKRGYIPEIPGYIDMVLLAGLGKLHKTHGIPITQVPEAVVLEAFHSRISAKEQTRTRFLSRLGRQAERAGR